MKKKFILGIGVPCTSHSKPVPKLRAYYRLECQFCNPIPNLLNAAKWPFLPVIMVNCDGVSYFDAVRAFLNIFAYRFRLTSGD